MKAKLFPVIGGAALYIFNRPNPFQDSRKWDAMLRSGRSMGNASMVRMSCIHLIFATNTCTFKGWDIQPCVL